MNVCVRQLFIYLFIGYYVKSGLGLMRDLLTLYNYIYIYIIKKLSIRLITSNHLRKILILISDNK